MISSYRHDIDAIKGISIIAVVLFHMGLLKSGYLGVDVFFVINGFLVIPSVVKKIDLASFSFLGFIKKRIVRLLPLIVLASVVALGLGYFLMMPDHYENLAQSVIASNLMSENILSALTTKNYWDVVNEYKPLMHLWYVGILFEFYIIMPIMMLCVNMCAKVMKKDGYQWMVSALAILTLVSLVLYLLPNISAGNRFYYLQYRFFELGLGGLVALFVHKWGQYSKTYIQKVAVVLLIAVVFCSLYNIIIGRDITGVVIGKEMSTNTGLPFPSILALLLTVIITFVLVACKDGGSLILRSKSLAWLGKMSYSIFIWHQVLLAFYRYFIAYDMSLATIITFLVVTLGVSVISYYWVEKKISETHRSFVLWVIAAILVMLPSGYLVMHAGVVRDVPELDVVKGKEYRGMFGEYCDRVYQYKNFPKDANGKINVLVEGVSFGRDFANVLLESEYKDSINLVYCYTWNDKNITEKIKNADYIFAFNAKKEIPQEVWDNIKPGCIIKGISTKNYGSCNGIIYKNRASKDYFKQVATIDDGYQELNEEWKRQWGNNYIDLLSPSMVDGRHVRVFTNDNKFISQDCRHLTRAGAKWYSSLLNWNVIFSK